MNSFIGTLFCILIVGSAAAWHFHKDYSEALVREANAERLLNQARTAIHERKVHLEALKRHYEVQRRIYDSNLSLAEARTVMTELQDSVASQKRVYQSMLESRRERAKGQVIELLELADGRELRNAKILNFDDTTISLLTTDGIVKVRAQDLQSDLKDYFRLDLIEPETEPLLVSSANQSYNANTYSSTAGGYSGNYNSYVGSGSSGTGGNSSFQYTAPTLSGYQGELSSSEKVKLLSANISALNKHIQGLERGKQAPLTGFDARLRPGSASYKHRKKSRDDKLDREIAILLARRKTFEVERKQISASSVSSR